MDTDKKMTSIIVTVVMCALLGYVTIVALH